MTQPLVAPKDPEFRDAKVKARVYEAFYRTSGFGEWLEKQIKANIEDLLSEGIVDSSQLHQTRQFVRAFKVVERHFISTISKKV